MRLLRSLHNNGYLKLHASYIEGHYQDLTQLRTASRTGNVSLVQGGALFDGASYLQYEADAIIETSDFTFYAVVQPQRLGTVHTIFNKETGGGTSIRFGINASNVVECRVSDTTPDSQTAVSTTTLVEGNVYHIACTGDRDGNMQTYINGSADGTAKAMAGVDNISSTLGNLRVGATYTPANYMYGIIKHALIINRVLTPNEMIELYSELNNYTSDKSNTSRSLSDNRVKPTEEYLNWGMSFEPTAGYIWDVSSNALSIGTTGLRFNNTIYGTYLDLYATGNPVTAIGNTASLQLQDFLLYTKIYKNDVGVQDIFLDVQGNQLATRYSGVTLGCNANNKFFCSIADTSSTRSVKCSTLTYSGTGTYELAVYKSGTEFGMIVNKDEIRSATLSAATVYYGTANRRTIIGAGCDALAHTSVFTGGIYEIKQLKTTAMTSTIAKQWINNHTSQDAGYNAHIQGKSCIVERTDSGTAIDGTGFYTISNTGATVSVRTAMIRNNLCKILQGFNSVYLYKPINGMINPGDAAYGTWEFWVNYGGNLCTIGFVSQTKNLAGNFDYTLAISATGQVTLYDEGSAIRVQSADAYLTSGIWYKVTITRSRSKYVWVYINDVLMPVTGGANPGALTELITNNYLVVLLGTGAQFSLGSRNGKYGYSWRQNETIIT